MPECQSFLAISLYFSSIWNNVPKMLNMDDKKTCFHRITKLFLDRQRGRDSITTEEDLIFFKCCKCRQGLPRGALVLFGFYLKNA